MGSIQSAQGMVATKIDRSRKIVEDTAAIKITQHKQSMTKRGKSYEDRILVCQMQERKCKLKLRESTHYPLAIGVVVKDTVDYFAYRMALSIEKEGDDGLVLEMGSDNIHEGSNLFHCLKFDRNEKKTKTAGGGLTETTIHLYGLPNSAKDKGLVVLVWKKKSADEHPYMLTLTHYFARLSSPETGGASVSLKIRGDRSSGAGKLDVEIENPVIHPAPALFCMFDQVATSGIWKPTMCYHCARNGNQKLLKNVSLSDTEDSNNVGPAATSNSIPQNLFDISQKGGVTTGNGNNSVYIARTINMSYSSQKGTLKESPKESPKDVLPG